jgi:predicted GH43/DUF377 family glycosyl hydrolase
VRRADERFSIAASRANHGAGTRQSSRGQRRAESGGGAWTDGQLYLFPRLVARGNLSRIGIARVIFNAAGDPTGVERLGIALEPEPDYELWPHGGGGCEDPRVTFVERIKRYVMTYTAFAAGVMVLSKEHPHLLRYRSAEPVLTPLLPHERHGIVPNVVFSTGIDRRDDLGQPDRFDVYYGMADSRVGVARLDVPQHLPMETTSANAVNAGQRAAFLQL